MGSFAFWLKRGGQDPHGAFMLNWSAGGAAFLTGADDTPHVGERVKLSEMASSAADESVIRPPLPRLARVVRVEDRFSELRRVAVQFESRVDASLERRLSREALRKLAAPLAPELTAAV